MQKLQNEEKNFLVQTSLLVEIFLDKNKNVKKGLTNIMVLVLVWDVPCDSLLEILDGLITFPTNVGPRISSKIIVRSRNLLQGER